MPAYPTFPKAQGSDVSRLRFKNFYMLAYPTFPKPQGSKYHRISALSLLCSEWEEVGHTLIKHQQIKNFEYLHFSAGGGRFLTALMTPCSPRRTLLCSEWEEVGHAQTKHRQTARMVRYCRTHTFCLPPVCHSREGGNPVFS